MGLKGLPFVPPVLLDHPDNDARFQSISTMKFYQGYSFEELRLSDSVQDKTVSPNANATTTSSSKPALRQTLPLNELFRSMGKTDREVEANSGEIYHWIRAEIKASRGIELQGTLNPSVLPILFHKQIEPWKELAEDHFSSIKFSIALAVSSILASVCKEDATKKMIQDFIRQSSERQGTRYSRQLTSHIDGLRTKHLQTSNEAFEQKVKEARLLRFSAALERYRPKSPPSHPLINTAEDSDPDISPKLVIDLRDTAALFAELHMSNSQNLEDEVHDTLKAYYEIAKENFVAFVNDQIVERYLDDPQEPVYAFSPVYVGGLIDAEIGNMAAEDETVVRDRAEKEATLSRLLKAEKIAERYLGPD